MSTTTTTTTTTTTMIPQEGGKRRNTSSIATTSFYFVLVFVFGLLGLLSLKNVIKFVENENCLNLGRFLDIRP